VPAATRGLSAPALSAPAPAPDTGDTVRRDLIKGTTEARLGNREEAILDYEAALDADPPSARILKRAGDVEQALGNDDAARSCWKQALHRSPNRFSLQQKLDGAPTP